MVRAVRREGRPRRLSVRPRGHRDRMILLLLLILLILALGGGFYVSHLLFLVLIVAVVLWLLSAADGPWYGPRRWR